jgi:methylase of polypeptide subunit release factors
MTNYDSVTLGGVDVCFTPELDGGGGRYGQDYVRFVSESLGPRRRTFEWCAGPGFIGFSLLGHGLTDTLCLADVNPAAIAACRETVRRNGLEDAVALYVSDNLDALPPDERWDLVVGNPPHSGTDDARPEIDRPTIIYQDPGWLLHQRFYASVRQHLEPSANVVIQENRKFSSPETFRPMLEANGLRLVECAPCENSEGAQSYFYVWSTVC